MQDLAKQQEIEAIVSRIVREITAGENKKEGFYERHTADLSAVKDKNCPVKGQSYIDELKTGENKSTDNRLRQSTDRPAGMSAASEAGFIKDITEVDLKKQYLVAQPKKAEAFLTMKAKTPARLGIGRAGARYKTETMLRVRADHAAAQDSVFSDVEERWVKEHKMVFVQTRCKNKDEYLTRPDLGRRFDEETLALIKQTAGNKPEVMIVVGDGLSSAAVEANAPDMVLSLKQGLSVEGIHVGEILFVKYARVGAMDDIGEATGAKVICMLVGERPGLVTAQSMSAYITYEPRHGIAESKRTVISNIHKGGTNAAEAGAHAAGLIKTMLEKKASGVELRKLLV